MVDIEKGLAFLTNCLGAAGVLMIERARPWPGRSATYLVLGNSGRTTDIVFTDTFLRDLPGTQEYQADLTSYASALAGGFLLPQRNAHSGGS